MPLALRGADDRTFDSLMEDARARIPRLARGWTDHNGHDPGITLLELLAWLTETDLFRAGRVSDASRRAFLRWFGLELHGPTVAHTILALSSAPDSTLTVPIPANTAVTSAGGDVVFTTSGDVNVRAVRLAAVLTSAPAGLVDRTAAHERGEPFAAFGTRAAKGDALHLGFDRPVTGELQLYLWTGATDHDDLIRGSLQIEAQAAAERTREIPFAPASVGGSAPDWRRHYGVETVWEARTAAGWKPVAMLDETRALTLSGIVRLSIDVPHVADAGHYFLRCRIVRGRFECPPALVAVLPNAVAAHHRSRPFTGAIGTSDGRAGQSFRVDKVPLVEPGTSVVGRWVDPDSGAVDEHEWPIVRSWDRVSPGERVAIVDSTAGEIHFGNGRTGSVPRAGAAIIATWRRGGGAAGNVASHTLAHFASGEGDGAVAIAQPFAARGGADAESLADLQGRLLDRLARPARAVSADDLRRIALETPGVPVGRVRVLPMHDLNLPGLPAAGCVTVVVVPCGDGPRPEPTAAMLAAVRCYLEPRRPVATELHVVGPTYTLIAIHARLHVAPGSDAAAIAGRATTRVNAFFHPLNGGPEGTGWTAGRAVYRAEIFALLQDTPGVLWVEKLSLVSGEGDKARRFCGNVVVCPTSLIAAAGHAIEVAEAVRSR